MKEKRFLPSYSVFDIIVIAMCAGLGIAVKLVITPLAHIFTGPLFIPGGAVAGGFYMLFVVLSAGLVGKHFAATLTCLVQAVLVIITGVMGSHGIFSLVTYTAPGLAVDLIYLPVRRRGLNAVICFIMGMAANITGTYATNLLFFRAPFIPLMLALLSAALMGGLGGLITWSITKQLKKHISVFSKPDERGQYEK